MKGNVLVVSSNEGGSAREMTIGILIFDDVEELDFIGPLAVFASVNEVRGKARVFTVAERLQPIRTHGGVTVSPAHSFADFPPVDVLIVPGGAGRKAQMRNRATLDFMRERAHECKHVASVCTGAFILAEAGLLSGKRATTHWSALEELRQQGDIEVCEERFVDQGSVLTAGGVTAGMDMALHMVETLWGEEIASRVARRLEYSPQR